MVVPSHAAGVKIGVSTRVKPCDIEIIAHRLDDFVAHPDDGVLPLAAQPQMPVIHQEVDAVIFGRDRIRIGFRNPLQDLHALDIHFDSRPARAASARILPRTISDDSCVRFFMVSKTSSGSALFTATHCMRPVPSRRSGNTILPDLRRL